MHWYTAFCVWDLCVVFVKNANENIPLSNIIEEFGILHNIIYLFIILVFIYY